MRLLVEWEDVFEGEATAFRVLEQSEIGFRDFTASNGVLVRSVSKPAISSDTIYLRGDLRWCDNEILITTEGAKFKRALREFIEARCRDSTPEMKPLSQMTRDELFALSNTKVADLYFKMLQVPVATKTCYPCLCNKCTEQKLTHLELHREKLQQTAAEARQQTER